jgi:hypothetical protein
VPPLWILIGSEIKQFPSRMTLSPRPLNKMNWNILAEPVSLFSDVHIKYRSSAFRNAKVGLSNRRMGR